MLNCPKCGPITPSGSNSKLCPRCYRLLKWSEPAISTKSPPVPPLIHSPTSPVTYVNSSLDALRVRWNPKDSPAVIQIANVPYWLLTVPVYAKLWQATEAATRNAKNSDESAVTLIAKLAYIESLLFESYPDCGSELAKSTQSKISMPKLPFVPYTGEE